MNLKNLKEAKVILDRMIILTEEPSVREYIKEQEKFKLVVQQCFIEEAQAKGVLK